MLECSNVSNDFWSVCVCNGRLKGGGVSKKKKTGDMCYRRTRAVSGGTDIKKKMGDMCYRCTRAVSDGTDKKKKNGSWPTGMGHRYGPPVCKTDMWHRYVV